MFQVSSLWCTTDEPLESFEYIGQFSPLLGHKLELFQWTIGQFSPLLGHKLELFQRTVLAWGLHMLLVLSLEQCLTNLFRIYANLVPPRDSSICWPAKPSAIVVQCIWTVCSISSVVVSDSLRSDLPINDSYKMAGAEYTDIETRSTRL